MEGSTSDIQGLSSGGLWSAKCIANSEPSFVSMIHGGGCGWKGIRTGDRDRAEAKPCEGCGGEVAVTPIPDIKH